MTSLCNVFHYCLEEPSEARVASFVGVRASRRRFDSSGDRFCVPHGGVYFPSRRTCVWWLSGRMAEEYLGPLSGFW
jgi:hypothetical protein